MTVRLAVVQPRSHTGVDESRNAADALRWLERARAEGAELVMFPEGYPGPTSPGSNYDALTPLAARAAQLGLHVLASRIAPVSGGHAMELHLIDDGGRIAGIYRRTTPLGPYIYHDIDAWGFDYVASDTAPTVVQTRLGRIGMLVCSGVFVPELSRLLTLQGAEILLYPAGGAINELLPAWRTMVWARAIENVAFTAACQNLYGSEDGVAVIAAPEGILAQSSAEGLTIADLDMERLAFLRREDERISFPKSYASIPGLARWRRPELYEPIAAIDEAATAASESRKPALAR